MLAAFLIALACNHPQAEECDRFAVAVATVPAPYQHPQGLKKADALLSNVPAQADVVLIGDSLAANWPADMARRQFRPGHVWNFAVGGSTSQNTLWQLGALKANGLTPRVVIVVIGTNNLTRDDMPACAIAAGIKAVATETHRIWPGAQLHVMGIPPRGADFHFRDGARRAVNSEIRGWATQNAFLRYFEVDPSAITCGYYDRAMDAAASSSNLSTPGASACPHYADDFGHFKRAGYTVIFEAISLK